MGRYRAGIETRERIIAATRDLLAEEGLEAATLKAICDRAGVRAGSFYNLFATKDDPIIEVVRAAIQAVDPHPGGEDGDTVAELVEAYIRFITGDPGLARIYLQLAVSGGLDDEALGRRMLSHHRNRAARFGAAIAREAPRAGPGEAEWRAELMLATLNGLAFRWLLEPDFDFGERARHLVPKVATG